MVKVKEGRVYSVTISIQDVTDFPGALGHVANATVQFTTDTIDNFSMNYEAAPFWARQRLQHCLPVLLDGVAPDFLLHATKDE